MKKLLVLLLLLGAVVGATGLWYAGRGPAAGPTYRTAAVKRGPLVASISATGTLQPEEVVDVGAQVAGMIKNFGADPRDSTKAIDYTTPVEAGTVLAEIDDSIYRAQVEQAEANVEKARADLSQMEAKVGQAERDWNRVQLLGRTRGIVSDLDTDTAQAAVTVAKAGLGVGRATLKQAESALRQAKINLGYCTIRSPVKGVIVDRRVNVGQTVVASLNAPSLFLIAKDLKRMQIWASVNEADIGQIQPGQPVRFTVDAHPTETFTGQVAQIRLNASMTQNVVTYTVIVTTDNSSGRLLPYLTANLQFEVGRRSDALLVPSAALNWQPSKTQIAPDADAKDDDEPGSNRGTVWVQDGEFVRPIAVQTGLSDNTNTEIVAGELQDKTRIVVGATSGAQRAAAEGGSPFTPQMFKGKKGG